MKKRKGELREERGGRESNKDKEREEGGGRNRGIGSRKVREAD